jgi:hypothetical protein
MPFASEESVNRVLKPYFADMVTLVQGAFADWKESPFAATMQTPTVRANVVWNQFLFRAKARFDDRPGVKVETMRHWQGLVVEKDFFVRMKACGARLLSSNYPTQSALNFNDATVDLFKGVVRLELLYSLNELQTEIDRIVVAQRHRNKILWAINILDDDGASAQTVIPMPAPVPSDSPAKRVIKPKKTFQKLNKNQGTSDGGE